MGNKRDEIEEIGIDDDDVESIIDERSNGIGLAELLQQAEEPPKKEVEGASSQSGSGLLNLASLVANASVEQAKRPSVAPPMPYDVADARAPDGLPMEIATSDVPPPFKPVSTKRYLVPVFIAMAFVFVFAVAAILVLQQRRATAAREVEEAKFALLKTEIEKVKVTAVPAAPVAEPVVEEAPKPVEVAEEKVEALQEAAEEEAEEPETKALKSSKRSSNKSSRHRRSRRSRRKAKREVAKEAAKEEAEKRPADDLDFLIGSGSGSRRSSAKASAKGGSSARPSRAQINSAMSPVARQASSCAKYATGIVQLRITIGGDGRVKSARTLGGFAGTSTGRCVEAAVKSAKFPKFDDDSFTFTYPVTIR